MKKILTKEQVDQFHEQGFVRINNVFNAQELAELETACDNVYRLVEELADRGQANKTKPQVIHDGSKFTYQFMGDQYAIRHVAWCGQCEPIFDRYGQDQRLLQIAGELLNSEQVEQQINQIHYKKPGTGLAFKWHQDAMHRGIARGLFKDIAGGGSYVQIALAIDDVDEDLGPLGFVPGSNQLQYLGALYDDEGNFSCDKIDLDNAVFPLLKRGDVVAFGSYTVHGSKPNISTKFRRTFINGFAYPGASKKTPKLPGEGRTLDTDIKS